LSSSGSRVGGRDRRAGGLPPWFTETFLDFREDVARPARASASGSWFLFEQNGCPYCKELILTNFSQKAIADKARKNFLAISLNIWATARRHGRTEGNSPRSGSRLS